MRRCKVWYEHYHALLAAALCSSNNTQPTGSPLTAPEPQYWKDEEPTLAMAYYYDDLPNLGPTLQLLP